MARSALGRNDRQPSADERRLPARRPDDIARGVGRVHGSVRTGRPTICPRYDSAMQRAFAALVALCMTFAVGCSTDEASDPDSDCPTGEIVGWGDSLTYSLTEVGGAAAQADPTWLATVAKDLDVDTANFGVPSQGSAEIAVRQGGLKPRVTLSGNEIPAGSASAVPITSIDPADGWTQYVDAGTMEMRGTLAGAAGTLQHTVTNGASSFSFVPAAAADAAVPVPANSTFESGDGADYRGCVQIIWAGTNNRRQKDAILRDIASMVKNLVYPKRYLIIGTLAGMQGELSATYGPRFVNLRAWLISDGLAAAGIAATPEDTAAIAAGNVPPSLTTDGTHFTPAAYTAIGHHVADVLRSAGLA